MIWTATPESIMACTSSTLIAGTSPNSFCTSGHGSSTLVASS
jgi:hypothetical protein